MWRPVMQYQKLCSVALPPGTAQTDNRPAATAAVMTGGISLPRFYKIIFLFLVTLSVRGCSDMPPVVTDAEVTGGKPVHAQYELLALYINAIVHKIKTVRCTPLSNPLFTGWTKKYI